MHEGYVTQKTNTRRMNNIIRARLQEFLFSLYMDAEHISILMYDDDSITDDDLIGSVRMNIIFQILHRLPFAYLEMQCSRHLVF